MAYADATLLPTAPVPVAPGARTVTQTPISPSPSTSGTRSSRNPRGTRPMRGYASSRTLDSSNLPALVRQLLANARAPRASLVSRWRRSYFYLTNRPNLLPAGSPSRTLPQPPEIFPIVAHKVGYKTDRRFTNTITASPLQGTGFFETVSQLSDDLGVVMDSSWHVNLDETEVVKAIWDSEIYGTGWLKTCWDLGLANGMGDAHYSRVDPFTVYPDPAAHSPADWNYVIEARRMSLQEMDRRWPGSARLLNGQGWLEEADEAPQQSGSWSQTPKANPGLIPASPSGNVQFMPYKMTGGRGGFDMTDDPGVTVLEAWLREHTNIPDPDAPFGYVQHDTWRCVVVAGNHVLLDCDARDMWAHGGHPYSRVIPHDIGEMYGFSTVELLIPSQASINRLLSALVLNTELTGNPVFISSSNSGIDRQQITNRPGQRLTMNSNTNARAEWMDPPQASPMMPELIRYFLQRMEAVSGMGPVSKGASPGGRNAQHVVDAMQESAHVRVRMELRQLEYALRDAGVKKASLIVENYTQPRVLSILGPDGAESWLALSSRHFMLAGPNGEAPLTYTLQVDAGADSATSRKTRKDEATTLFTLGGIDQMALLDAYDWPNRTEIFKRIQYQMAAGTFQPPGARQRSQRST